MNELEFKVGKVVEEKDYHIFTVQTIEKTSPDGKTSNFTKLKAPDWAGAIVKCGDKFLCTKEYRHGIDKVVYQFPCGTVEKDETPLQCCIRELTEELGLKNSDLVSVTQLYKGCPNPAFMDNSMTFFVACVSNYSCDKQKLDENEFIEPVFLTKEEVEKFVNQPDANIMFQNAWRVFKEKYSR